MIAVPSRVGETEENVLGADGFLTLAQRLSQREIENELRSRAQWQLILPSLASRSGFRARAARAVEGEIPAFANACADFPSVADWATGP